MATVNDLGNIVARCPGTQCGGSLSTYEWVVAGNPLGVNRLPGIFRNGPNAFNREHRLFRCAGCGRGGLALLEFPVSTNYPSHARQLIAFHQEVGETLRLPAAVPQDIQREFREAEACISNSCYRAAAAMIRSVLDKTLRANGYKLKNGTTLEQQIDLAASDGVITESRRRRAHEEVRVLGNDVLHDDWREIPQEDVAAAHHYVQRILEDFYDERESTLKVLIAKGRLKADDLPPA